MSLTLKSVATRADSVSPLMLSHTLLELAERADRAGFTVSAGQLVALAHSVCSDRPARRARRPVLALAAVNG